MEIEGCWDSFFDPPFKSKYCNGFEFFGKALLEVLVLLAITAGVVGIGFIVYKLSAACAVKRKESKMLEQMRVMAEIDG